MSIEFPVAVLCTAASVALAAHALFDMLATGPTDRTGERRPRPWLVRPVWRIASTMAPAVAVRAPSIYLSRVAARLRTAEFDRAIEPHEWVAVRLCYGLVGAAIVLTVAILLETQLVPPLIAGVTLSVWLPDARLRAIGDVRARGIRRELPLYLDVITLAVESGSSLTAAIAMAVEKSDDGPLRRALLRFLADVRAGRPRGEALKAMDDSLGLPETTAFVGALLQSERTGARLGEVLRHQSNQRSQERFARAEKAAMQAPVRMLGPLVLCIFPCTFIVLGFPIVVKLMAGF